MENKHRHIGPGCAFLLIAAVIFLFVLGRFLFSEYHHKIPAPHIIYTQSTTAPAPQSRIDCGAGS